MKKYTARQKPNGLPNRLFYIPAKATLTTLQSFVFLFFFQTALGQYKAGAQSAWQVVGTVEVYFSDNHDSLVIEPPFNDFKRLQIKVTEAPLRLIKLQITYEEGEPDMLMARIEIPDGGTSRPIFLHREDTRPVSRIDFWYDIRGLSRSRANVTILGMK